MNIKSIFHKTIIFISLFGLFFGPSIGAEATMIIDHRGDSIRYPENSMDAFLSSADRGKAGFECDVWTGDQGDLIIFHDKNLKDLCGYNIPVQSVNSSNRAGFLLKAGLGNPGLIRQEGIPFLEEVLRRFSDRQVMICLHVKDELSTDRIALLIRKYGMQDRTLLFCQYKSTMLKLRKYKDIRTGIMYDGPESYGRYLTRWAAEHDVDYIISYHSYKLTAAFVDYAHERGLATGVYETLTREEFNRLKREGNDLAVVYYDTSFPPGLSILDLPACLAVQRLLKP